MMKARLRSIERTLVRQRAEIAVYEFIDEIAERWPEVADPYADIHLVVELVNRLWDPDVGLHTMPAAIAHLEACMRRGQQPDPRALASIMAPWTVRPPR